MSLLADIWKGIRENSVKAIAGTAVAVVAAIYLWVWDLAKSRTEATLLNFLTDSLVADPYHYMDGGKQFDRDANYARAIQKFQTTVVNFAKQLIEADPDYIDSERIHKRDADSSIAIRDFQQGGVQKLTDLISQNPKFIGDPSKTIERNSEDVKYIERLRAALDATMEKDVRSINQGFIGYAQTGTFELDPGGDKQSTSDKKGTSSTQRSFNIVASRKSHVYLELTIGNFDKGRYDIRVTFFDQPVCSNTKIEPGYNGIELVVGDIDISGMHFLGRCKDEKRELHQVAASTDAMEEKRLNDRGHKDQLIPVVLKILPIDSDKPLPQVSFATAVAANSSGIRGQRSKLVTSQDPANLKPVQVEYIAIVSPLIEDSLRRDAGKHAEGN